MMNLLLDANNPGIDIFGFRIYYYAIIIVFGMIVAMTVTAFLMKKKGMKVDDLYTYVIFALPIGLLCARLYLYLFPYQGQTTDWSTFFDFRNGGLAIYGGIIGGALTLLVVSLVKKQNFFDIADCAAPGVMIAQAIGRWGNFVNQEAFGNLVTEESMQWFPYAVYIEHLDEWHQATFFYESMWNVVGFIIVLLLIFKWKNMRTMLSVSFYFIWYGIGRLIIEGLRTDSLYLTLFGHQFDIRVSQFVSVIAIVGGLVMVAVAYRREIKNLFFKITGKTDKIVENPPMGCWKYSIKGPDGLAYAAAQENVDGDCERMNCDVAQDCVEENCNEGSDAFINENGESFKADDVSQKDE